MHKKLNWKLCFIIACIVFTVFGTVNQNTSVSPDVEFGRPEVITEYVDFQRYAIKNIVHDAKCMYVLFSTQDNYVQVYDLDGHYRFTLAFYSYPNGTMSIAQSGGNVYMCDERQNLYVFHLGEFVEFIPQSKGIDIVNTLHFDQFSEQYEIRGSSVWRVDVDPNRCVIKRSIISWIYQTQILGIVVVCVVVILCLSVAVDGFKECKMRKQKAV